MALYRFYPDNFFEPYQLESGFYYGIRVDGRLVSVAGVHLVSERFDVGVLGNIVTHPDHRGRGLSTRCTGYLLEALFERVARVALDVDEGNAAAMACFEQFGFRPRCALVEGFASPR
jgi:predicted GNAT family acetyltransferase